MLLPVLSFVTMPSPLSPSLVDAVICQDYQPLQIKKCSVCKLIVPLSMFYRETKSKDGHQSKCISCSKQYRKDHPIQQQTVRMLSNARSRAKKFNVPLSITLDYVRSLVGKNTSFVSHCPVLGLSLEWSAQRQEGKNTTLPNSPTLDRIVPELGYVENNVRIISHRANMLKNNASLQELHLVLADAAKLGLG